MSAPRYTLSDYAGELDFASKRIVQRAGPAFSLVWSDIHLGSGVACLVGPSSSGPIFRFFRSVSEPYASSTGGEAQIHGSSVITELAQVALAASGTPASSPPLRDIHEDLAFLDASMPLYTRCWAAMGSTWPVAMMHRGGAEKGHWVFVQVAKSYPERRRVLVDLVVTRQMMLAQRAAMKSAHSQA